MTTPVYAGFLGTWILIPESCQYEQGQPPREGRYTISHDGEQLRFVIAWTDAEGQSHTAEFAGPPDGSRVDFEGGPLADALSITAVSARELNSAAYFAGEELMLAQRQLDASGGAMRVVQRVRLPDGSTPLNISVYRRQVLN